MDSVIQFIQSNSSIISKIIFITIFLLVFSYIIFRIDMFFKRKIRTFLNNINKLKNISGVNSNSEVINSIAEGMMNNVEPKSVGGSTKIYLKQIMRDFPDYNNEDAENAIKTFVFEYLEIKYGIKNNFVKSRISDKILLTPEKTGNNISNIKLNEIAIYRYSKTTNFATITYRCSVGFDNNGNRIETRYEVDYTLQLAEDNIASLSMKCENCGGVLSSTDELVCPYCGAAIIKDTILNWFITEIKEL